MQNMKLRHYVSETSTPTDVEQNLSLVPASFRGGGPLPSRNLPEIFLQQYQQQTENNFTQESVSNKSPENHKVRFRENQIHQSKRFTTPTQSQPNSNFQSLQSLGGGNHHPHGQNTSNFNQVREFNSSAANPNSSPSQYKIIDLRNQHVRKLVMDSLNDIIQERKKQRVKHNQNYESIVQSTPQSLRVQNSIDDEAVLIERINLQDQQLVQPQRTTIDEIEIHEEIKTNGHSRPPSRIAADIANNQENNNGILMMSPRSQQKFFISLEKIYQQQDKNKINQEFIEEPASPEYTIVQAIDDSCVLFAVKDQVAGQAKPSSDSNSGSNSSRVESAIKLQSPNVNRNFFDTDRMSLSDPETIKLLAARLKGIENQENNPNPRRNEVRLRQQMRGGLLIESYSTDKQFLMIHPQKLKKLTPSLKAPQISRQPSITNIDFFDLSEPYHAELLCQRLQDLRNLEETNEESDDDEEESKSILPQQEPVTEDLVEIENNNNSQLGSQRDPLPTRGPPSRGGDQEIDIDLLIKKLLQIPNDELLDSLFNLSISQDTQLLYNESQANDQQNLNSHVPIQQQGRDSDQASDYDSSGIQTPGSLSFSTPIQAKLFMERGNLLGGGKQNKGLDLRSPSTKFNLMRKLQEVKELNNSSEEDNDTRVAGDNDEEMPRFHRDYYTDNNQQQTNQVYPRGGFELRSLNDFTRMYINEEDDEDEADSAEEVKSSSQPTSLISPQRSLNSTQNQLQLRNLNSTQHQTPPLIEILIQKLRRLEDKRMRQQQLQVQRFEISEDQSNQSSETHSPQKTDNYSSIAGIHQANAQQNILEQVIKRLERLKRSRDSSV